MFRYYAGRGLQILGLILTAEALILYFGQMGPLMTLAAAGVCTFYLGRVVAGRPGS